MQIGACICLVAVVMLCYACYMQPEPEQMRHEYLSSNLYDIVEEHEHCHVQVLKNSVTGEISRGWWEEDV